MADPRGGGRILLITNNLPPVRGGSGIVYDNLARFAGGAVRVVAPRLSYTDGLPLIGWREHDRHAPYTITRRDLLRTTLATGPRGPLARLLFRGQDAAIRFGVLLTVLAAIRRDGVRAVCIGELIAFAWLLDALRLLAPATRRIVYVHGEEITTDDGYDTQYGRRRHALGAAHGIIAVSRFTANAITTILGSENAGHIRLIENGVDTQRFRPAPRAADLARQYGLDGKFVFVTVCRLLEKKGVDFALRAFASLAADFPDARFLVVGDGPHRATLETIAAECGIAARVVFAGAVADHELAAHYALGDVFVMPNRRLPNGDTEGFGLVFLEANACGLPVIAGRDGGSVDAVRDGQNGLLVDSHSVPAIAEAMRRLCEDPALRARLSETGRAMAEQADWRLKASAFVAAALPDAAP